ENLDVRAAASARGSDEFGTVVSGARDGRGCNIDAARESSIGGERFDDWIVRHLAIEIAVAVDVDLRGAPRPLSADQFVNTTTDGSVARCKSYAPREGSTKGQELVGEIVAEQAVVVGVRVDLDVRTAAGIRGHDQFIGTTIQISRGNVDAAREADVKGHEGIDDPAHGPVRIQVPHNHMGPTARTGRGHKLIISVIIEVPQGNTHAAGEARVWGKDIRLRLRRRYQSLESVVVVSVRKNAHLSRHACVGAHGDET